jgi:uncharacterized protein
MKLAIVSDTHSRYPTVAKALAVLQAQKINRILHCGDIEDSETVFLFQGFTTHFVYGNCDTDRTSLARAIKEIGGTLQEPFGDLEIADRKIAWIHGDNKRLFQDVERSGHFDYLFYGHTHQAEQHCTGPTRVVNPGALHRAKVKTFVILDFDTCSLETVAVD